MDKSDDFYIVHLSRELELKKLALKNGNFEIEREDIYFYNPVFAVNEYTVRLNSQIVFKFKMETTPKPIKSYILKNRFSYTLDNENTMDEFIETCSNFVKKVIADYETISKNFYIKEDASTLDIIYLKVPIGQNNWEFTKIQILFDGTYTLMTSFVDLYTFTDINDLIKSPHIEQLRKTRLHNFLRAIRLFYNSNLLKLIIYAMKIFFLDIIQNTFDIPIYI